VRLVSAAKIINKRLNVIVGHYGVGKTNLSLNLAFDLAAASQQVMLVDLDIVNPYFRSSDYQDDLEAGRIDLIAPVFAGTTLDTPTLPPKIAAAFEHDGPVIFDVGGDDAGATALGVYRERLGAAARAEELNFYYVVNSNRNLTENAAQATAIAREIETAAGVALTAVINNSHLQDETELSTVAQGFAFGVEVAAALELPLVATTLPIALAPVARASAEFAQVTGEGTAGEEAAGEGTAGEEAAFYPVTRLVLPPWS
jgi:hypothetical protein